MEGQGSSFIPKNTTRVSTTRTRGTHRIYILSYISYIVFFGTLFSVAGVFLYASSVDKSLESLKTQLVEQRNKFSATDIESIKLLDKRLNSAEQLVNESAAPSAIFADLESIVSDSVYFSGASYKYLPNRQFQIALTGRATEFDEVLWQQELLKGGNILKNAEISEYDYSVEGETEGATVSTGDAVLTFVISSTQPTSVIPYVPAINPEEGSSTSTADLEMDATTASTEEDQATSSASVTSEN